MANKNSNTLSAHYGLKVTVEDGQGVVDYAQMRASQLDALAAVLVTSDFYTYSGSIQHDVLWLVSTLATEVKELMPIVYDRGEMRGRNPIKPSEAATY